MRFIFCGKALLLAGLLSLPTLARADDFTAKNDAAVARNPAGVRCELRFSDGKSRFQMGETIRVTLTFSSDSIKQYRLDTYLQGPNSWHKLGNFKASPGDDVANPLADLPTPSYSSIAGYVPKPTLLSTRPTEITVDLNQYLRFDRPGIYQIYCDTSRVFDDTPSNREFGARIFGGYGVTSNVVPLEILPADLDWAHEQVEEQRKIWRAERLFRSSPRPNNDLSYLGTQEAALAIIERLGVTTDTDEAIYRWNYALVGFRDRSWLIETMKRTIERPDYGVTTGFVNTLSLLTALEAKKLGAPVPQTALPSQYFGNLGSPIEIELRKRQTAQRRTLYELVGAALPLKLGRAKQQTKTTLIQEEKFGFGLAAPTLKELKKLP